MRRLLRPAVLLPLAVVLLFGGGVLYAVTTGLNAGAVDENESTLAGAGAMPGAKEVGRQSETFSGEESLPVPRGVVTTIAYAPAAGTGQNAVVNYYVERLRPAWKARVERSLAGAAGTTEERSFRVTFSRDHRCLVLGTAGMAAGLERPVYTLSAYKRSGGNC